MERTGWVGGHCVERTGCRVDIVWRGPGGCVGWTLCGEDGVGV